MDHDKPGQRKRPRRPSPHPCPYLWMYDTRLEKAAGQRKRLTINSAGGQDSASAPSPFICPSWAAGQRKRPIPLHPLPCPYMKGIWDAIID